MLISQAKGHNLIKLARNIQCLLFGSYKSSLSSSHDAITKSRDNDRSGLNDNCRISSKSSFSTSTCLGKDFSGPQSMKIGYKWDPKDLREKETDEEAEINNKTRHSQQKQIDLRPTSCKDVLLCQEGQLVRIQGWIRGLRKLKKTIFLDINDGSTFHRIPVVLKAEDKPNELSLLSSVDITGELIQNPKKPAILEIHPTQPIQVLGLCDQQKYPTPGKWEAKYEAEHLRQYYHLRFKTSKFASLTRLRSFTSQAIHEYFSQNDFFQIHTPIITSNDCEGAGETFTVRPASDKLIAEMTNNGDKKISPECCFFNEQIYLSVSGQLHLEAVTGGLEKVWTFSPIFRAENNHTTRHLTEFYMVEAEIAFLYQIEQLLQSIEDLVKFCIRKIVFDQFAEFNYYFDEKSDQKLFLESILKHPFTIMTFEEARALLLEKRNSPVLDGKGLNREQELILVEQLNNNIPVFVINWPSQIKPFYMRECPETPNYVSAVDLLVPRIGELVGGSLRETNLALLESKLDSLDPTNKLKTSLNWYLDLRRFGNVPTGGFGLGFDRLLQFMFNSHNIKDVSLFPRWPHNCPM